MTEPAKKPTRKPAAKKTVAAKPVTPKEGAGSRIKSTYKGKGEEFIEVLPGDTVWRISCRSASLSNTPLNFYQIEEEKQRLEKLNPNVTELTPGMKLRRW